MTPRKRDLLRKKHDLQMPRKRFLVAAAAVGVIVLIAWLTRRMTHLPSEIDTPELLSLLGGLVVLSALLVWLAFQVLSWSAASRGWRFAEQPYPRFAAAGGGLLVIGVLLALATLPENSTSSLSGSVGILPPFPAAVDRGFAIGLAAHPQGCASLTPITIVAAGSPAYWADHDSQPKLGLPFELVLPGHIENISVWLGRRDVQAVGDPAHAEVDRRLMPLPKSTFLANDLTVIAGSVREWEATRRSLIVKAEAPWVTHRGLADCNLHLPALSGEPSAMALVKAFKCEGLDREYSPGTCSDPPPTASATEGATYVSPSLEVTDAVSVVTGGDASTSESDPQPTTIRGSPGWRCRATSSTTPLRLLAEVGDAESTSQSDCHAAAIIQIPAWRRDFLIALIGAFLAVGVHMIFEAIVDAHKPAQDTPVQDKPAEDKPTAA